MMNTGSKNCPAIILAGGKGKRMGGVDKGAVELAGRRLVDHVFGRLVSQCREVLISGTHDYGLDLSIIPDRADGPKGPVAGLYAIWRYFQMNDDAPSGFFTVPVDGPNLRIDLCAALFDPTHSAIAADDQGPHPVFGWWRMTDLTRVFDSLDMSQSISMTALSEQCHCLHKRWVGEGHFINLNSRDDITAYQIWDKS